MILYNISVRTWFHLHSFKMSVVLSVPQYVRVHLSWPATHLSKNLFLHYGSHIQCAQRWFIYCIFFVLLNLQKDGSCLKHGFLSFRVTEKFPVGFVSLCSFPTMPSTSSPLPLTVKGLVALRRPLLFLTDRTDDETLLSSGNILGWAGLMLTR